MNWIALFIHLAGAANFGYALYYDLKFVHVPPHLKNKGDFDSMSAFPGKWKYLTIWNMVLQFVYHMFALIVNDFAGTSELNPKRQSSLQKFRDYIFASWVFPAGMFVSVIFWGIYAVDRELMFPKVLDSFYPTWLNHSTHTLPVVFILIESISVAIIYPKGIIGPLLTVSGICTYLLWICWVNHVSGVWAYPILQILNNYQRAAFMGGCAVAILACFFTGEFINKWRWGKGAHEVKTAKGGKSTKGKKKVK
ncbi:androgen-induced gene 1 protein isoform X2 [Folsomia candida]|uniref:androgen-induced gene 1 protein isoform X2 n=1 Tax=Folsomia candida TaxID=158441 RepID=UPI000B8FF653|nr:androgen-induced gene 1 protein isoform X2 [Folsomia candida]